ncbi:hypothetical protein ES703_102021 [subsurface metagenome]
MLLAPPSETGVFIFLSLAKTALSVFKASCSSKLFASISAKLALTCLVTELRRSCAIYTGITFSRLSLITKDILEISFLGLPTTVILSS